MLEKRFNYSEIEKSCILDWSKNDVFKFKYELENQPFCIMMPPPNVTGSLHMGHALTFTLQDILIRFNKKLGKNVLWQPGIDHAGIATEIIVEKNILEKKQIKKHDLGREKFLEQIWEWKSKSGDKIIEQLTRIGSSIDWNISRFTMDEGLSKSVNSVFINLFEKGLIYKDKRLVNWDPNLETAVSDLEVNQVETEGKMWFLEYDIKETNEKIIVATTRPETIFGDSAIAINPDNKRLKDKIGKVALIPIINKEIPIISDSYAEIDKGSGAVKITPAHDFNDFKVGKKHNLKFIEIFDKKASLNSNTPKNYQGLNRFKAREKVILELKKIGRIKKEIKNKMIIPVGDRSGEVIEPMLTDQWFLDSKSVCKEVERAISAKKINFHPKSWINTFNSWIKNIEPWCISRQIWWGHRIPIWYTDSDLVIAAESRLDAEKKLKKYSSSAKITHQDEDVLDTWFSSALWPFSTLGWPKENKILKKFYPSNVLVTGFDIIFFWVARMIMMGLEFMKDVPFENIYIHPLVKDEKGQKMSKSKGNVIDPIDLVNKYGADSLRFTLANLSTQGRDIKLSDKLVENSRNFITKIWNVARFSQFKQFKFDPNFMPDNCQLDLNKWILFRFYETKTKIIKNLDQFKFNILISELYHFIWNDFCDLYIELSKYYLEESKNEQEISGVFNFIFFHSLNLINPIIPFITEKIGKELNYIQDSFYNIPIIKEIPINFDPRSTDDFNNIIELIKKIRFKKNKNINQKFSLRIVSKNKEPWISKGEFLVKAIFKLNKISHEKSNIEEDDTAIVISGTKFVMKFEKKNISLNNKSTEKEINFYKKEIKYFEEKLSNKNFINKAPKNVIEEQKKKLNEALNNLQLLTEK